MQDITSTGRSKKKAGPATPADLPPEGKRLYEKHAKKASTRRFTGSSVPVANVHVPKSKMPVPQKNDDVAMKRRPLFATVDKKSVKEVTKKKKSSQASTLLGRKETKIAGALFLVALVTAGLAAFIFLPSADIAITIQTAPLLADQKLTLSSNPAVAPNSIAGNVFSEHVQFQSASNVTTTEIIGTKATGSVNIVNKTFDTQKIKERSRLVTKDGTLFYMLGAAIVPPASSSSLASVSVQVEAALAGTKGNIGPQKLNFVALDPSAQSLVYGEVTTALTKGSGEEVRIVADADIAQAKESAKAQAKSQVEQIARAQLQSGWSLLDESWDVQLESFTPAQKTGDKADSISYGAAGTARVFAYKNSDLTNSLQGALMQNLEENTTLFPGVISFTKSVDKINWGSQQAELTAHVTHSTIPNFSLNTLREKIVGRSKTDASAYINGIKGVQNASVNLWPFWVQNIPQIQKRITITVNSDR